MAHSNGQLRRRMAGRTGHRKPRRLLSRFRTGRLFQEWLPPEGSPWPARRCISSYSIRTAESANRIARCAATIRGIQIRRPGAGQVSSAEQLRLRSGRPLVMESDGHHTSRRRQRKSGLELILPELALRQMRYTLAIVIAMVCAGCGTNADHRITEFYAKTRRSRAGEGTSAMAWSMLEDRTPRRGGALARARSMLEISPQQNTTYTVTAYGRMGVDSKSVNGGPRVVFTILSASSALVRRGRKWCLLGFGSDECQAGPGGSIRK